MDNGIASTSNQMTWILLLFTITGNLEGTVLTLQIHVNAPGFSGCLDNVSITFV
jgi:hypothetical protein